MKRLLEASYINSADGFLTVGLWRFNYSYFTLRKRLLAASYVSSVDDFLTRRIVEL